MKKTYCVSYIFDWVGSDVETVQDDKDYCVDDGLASKPMQQSQMLSGQSE